MGRQVIRGRVGPVEALRTGVSPEDMEARIAAIGLGDLADVGVASPQTGDAVTYAGSQWVNEPVSLPLVNWMPDGDCNRSVPLWGQSADTTPGVTGLASLQPTWTIPNERLLKVVWTADGSAKQYAIRSTVFIPRNDAYAYNVNASVLFEGANDECIVRVHYFTADELVEELDIDSETLGYDTAGHWQNGGPSNPWPADAAYLKLLLKFRNTAGAVTDRVAYVDKLMVNLLTEAEYNAGTFPAFTAYPQPSIVTVDGLLFAAAPTG